MDEFKGEFDRDRGPMSAFEPHRTDNSWFLKFSLGDGPPSRPGRRRRSGSIRRRVASHREPFPFGPRPHLWSYTSDSLFDAGTHKMLVGWAVRWIRGSAKKRE